jgi:hypothetical protein
MIVQNPVVLDMMCTEFGWTQELGQAYVNDQAGVLDAIQRLRRQARNAGNLESSDEMLVETVNEGGQQAIMLTSPDPNVVNVPQYDVQRVYTSLDEDDDDGVSVGTTVLTGVLAFVGGFAVAKLFDDDDDDDWDDDEYYYPRYYGPPMPYYPHYAYRPVYPGYYPATVYAPPPAYPYAYRRTTVVYRDTDVYWNRYDDRTYSRRTVRRVESPITRARPNRPELVQLNARARRGPVRRAPSVADERGAYQIKRREAAASAERRRAVKGERRASGVDQPGAPATGGARTPKVKPIDRPAANRTGTKSGGRNVNRARGDSTGAGGPATGTKAGRKRAGLNAGGAETDLPAPRAGSKNRATTKSGGKAARRATPTVDAGSGEAATPGAGADPVAPRTGGKRGTQKAGSGRKRATPDAGAAAGEDTTQKAGQGEQAAPKAGGRGGGGRRGTTKTGSTKPGKPAPPAGGGSVPPSGPRR